MSLATLTVQLIVLVAVLPVVAAVAVNVLVVFPNTVGVPVTAAPLILNPAGSVFAVYVMALPAALVADKAVVEAAFWLKVTVELSAGLDQVTGSMFTVILKARSLSCS